jgi:hypothetical protein
MTDHCLTILDTHELLDGEQHHAWAWGVDGWVFAPSPTSPPPPVSIAGRDVGQQKDSCP